MENKPVPAKRMGTPPRYTRPIGFKFPTKQELKRRDEEVLDLLMKGQRRGEIVQCLSLKWGVSERTVDKSIRRTNDLFRQMAETSKVEHFNMAMGQLELLYKETVERKDFSTALKVRTELNKLLGLGTTHIDLTVKGDIKISFDGFDPVENNAEDIDFEELT